MKNFAIDDKKNRCYKYVKNQLSSFINNIKDIGSNTYFYGKFDNTITEIEKKTDMFWDEIINNHISIYSPKDIGKIIIFTSAKTASFRLYLINSIINSIERSIIKIDHFLNSKKIFKTTTFKEFLSDYCFYLKEIGYSRDKIRNIKRKLLAQDLKKQIKSIINKEPILANSQSFFMGAHNMLINNHIIKDL